MRSSWVILDAGIEAQARPFMQWWSARRSGMVTGMVDVSVPVEVSDWRPAPFTLAGETVFAVGDVHGCARELDALLTTVAATPRTAPRRLIFLGDLIDRGPDNLGALRAWAAPASARGVDRIDRIMGNHEQTLLLAIAGGPHAEKATAMWLTQRMGGGAVLAEMRAARGDPTARLDRALVASSLGDAFAELEAQASHVAIGNTLFVHGGIDPQADPDAFLARPWTAFTDARWAWIKEGFLDWPGGFGGRLVVHGHTPPRKHKALTGQADPHLFRHDRLGLDGGSALTGIVTGAQIEDGRYRVLRAGTQRD
jgi:serine/threonine protein phosphatase 1